MYRQHDLSGLAYWLQTVGVLVLGFVGLCGTAQAFAPHQISFQGQIFDPNGFPLEGTVTIQTGIWNAPDGGGLLYEEFHAGVPLANGVFDLQLGTGVDTGGGSLGELTEECFTGAERYLEVAVDGDVLTPRQQIGSGAYAFQCAVSGEAETAVYAETAGDADTVDGRHASELDQSAPLASHEADSSAHHVKTTSFADLVDMATDAQIPDHVTINFADISRESGYAGEAGNADKVDGYHASQLNQSSHLGMRNNPHGVTAAQVAAPSLATFLDHTETSVAHHVKTTTFPELTGEINNSQVPSYFTRDTELAAVESRVDALEGQIGSAGVFTIPAGGLIPRDHSVQYSTNGIRMQSTAGMHQDMQFNAPVFLPQGARITKITLEGKDSCGGEFGGRVLTELLRYTYNTYAKLATVSTTASEAPGSVRRAQTLSHVVDNDTYSYGISVYINPGSCAGSSVWYYKAIIEYSTS